MSNSNLKSFDNFYVDLAEKEEEAEVRKAVRSLLRGFRNYGEKG
ncbi:hypothetical protein HMPREF9383_2159 [Streptococcus sanguinis SK150]|uniref:Uncharacterized protein n=1 Tax=Streptococcus sanguinis SK150 TaxID=888811 RepID=F0IQ83_STRSA|nr:hypothetical protein HMPREF9383_2159 [Streptococcus sanguinis SK150]